MTFLSNSHKSEKLKIALCFSGQPRFIEMAFPLIRKYILEEYETDVFAHLWHGEELINHAYKYGGDGKWVDQRIEKNAIDIFKDLYQPIDLFVEKPKSFRNSKLKFEQSIARYYAGSLNNPLEPDFRNRTINNMISAFYSMSEVAKIKKIHEFKLDFKYDWVIRCRTDTLINSKIKLNKYDSSVLNYSSHLRQPDGMVNDWLNFGSSDVMDIFMNQYLSFDFMFEKTAESNLGAVCPEMIHKTVLDIHKITYIPNKIQISLPRF